VKKCILVLEDNTDRREAMQHWLDDRLFMYDSLVTDDPDDFMRHAGKRFDDVLVVSLDHDLHERPDCSTTLTGMLVVDQLVEMRPTFPVLLHTSNRHDGERMYSRLTNRGWSVDWVTPFDDTRWIATDWYPALKRAIRRAAKQDDLPSVKHGN